MKVSATVHMNVTPHRVWDVVSDITRTGEWSPETFEAEWTRGSTGPEVGAYFRGHVRRGGRGPMTYWSTCRVSACEPGRTFGFQVLAPGDRVITSWHYEIEPDGIGGSDVTESFWMQPTFYNRAYWLVAGWLRGPFNQRNIAESLERIKGIVETTGTRD